jgi:hypothetical protein
MALNCLIKSYDDSLIDLDVIGQMKGEERIARALDLANKQFNVSKLIGSFLIQLHTIVYV